MIGDPCDARDCGQPSRFEFTVGDRPVGLTGLEGWPVGAPDLADAYVPTGRVIRFCGPHAVQLRDAAHEEWLTHLVPGSVAPTMYGIRGHRVMTPDEAELARRYAEQAPFDPAALDEEPRGETR